MKEMTQELSMQLSENSEKDTEEKAAFELSLLNSELIGDFLFLIGTLLAFITVDLGEEALIKRLQKEQNQEKSLSTEGLKVATIESWLFFAASTIFAYIGLSRLYQLEEEPQEGKSVSDKVLLRGNQISSFGGIVKLIGFGITAIGNQIKYDSTKIVTK